MATTGSSLLDREQLRCSLRQRSSPRRKIVKNFTRSHCRRYDKERDEYMSSGTIYDGLIKIKQMSKSIGLLHLNLNVTDIVRSEHFYQQVFGYVRIVDTSGEIQRDGQNLFVKQIILGIPGANDLLALSELTGATVGTGGMSHFGIIVEDAEVEALAKKVVACGGIILEHGVREENGVVEPFAYVRDPDGYAIEIASQSIVYAQDFRQKVTIRQYQGESDLQLIIDLIDACEQVDLLESFVSIEQLRSSITNPAIDRERDLGLWEDAQGKLIGFGELSIDEPISDNLTHGSLWFFVHPIARSSGLEAQIIAWAEQQISEIARERQGHPKLLTWSRDSRIDRIAILEDRGFVEGRQFWFLTQSLQRNIPTSQLPEGFSIRAVDGEREAQAWVDLHNQAFCNAWLYHPVTVESYKHRLQAPDYLPELDLVAVDADGKFAAVCYCAIDAAHNIFLGRQEAWIALLFTSPDFQRRGLAKAMLFYALARLKARNIEIAKIGVDSENAYGARQLYESIGFKHHYTDIAYVKHL
jgi:mycothiol synthase